MAYKALYRKWRPMTFDDVIGQEHIVKTLKNEISENRIAHAYLFTGTRGTGKTSTAKILSRAINCENVKDSNPCNECEICKGILGETLMDIIEIDAASNTGVDNIRSIIEQVQYTPTVAKYKVYIIDEVHMLSQGAFNALLKTLEEPPKHVVFILATTEVHKIPATILSRCQRFDFKTISPSDITARIKTILSGEGITAEDAAIDYVAYLANGSMRDSLSILDQCLAFKSNNLTYADTVEILGGLDDSSLLEIADFIGKNDTKSALGLFLEIADSGKNIDDFAMRMLDVFSKIMVCAVTNAPLKEGSDKRQEKILSASKNFSAEHIMFCINVLSELINNLKFTKNTKTLIEVAITRMSEPCLCSDTGALLERIKRLEDKVAALSVSGAVLKEETQNGSAYQTNVSGENISAYQSGVSGRDEDDVPAWEEKISENKNLQVEDSKNSNIEKIEDIKSGSEQYKSTEIKEKDNEIYKNLQVSSENTPSSASEGASLKKITASWSEVINRSIKDGELSVYFALKDTAAADENGTLSIKAQDEEKRGNILSNKDKIRQYLNKIFNADIEIKAALSGIKQNDADPTDRIFDKLDELRKKNPQNFTSKGE